MQELSDVYVNSKASRGRIDRILVGGIGHTGLAHSPSRTRVTLNARRNRLVSYNGILTVLSFVDMILFFYLLNRISGVLALLSSLFLTFLNKSVHETSLLTRAKSRYFEIDQIVLPKLV